MSESDETPAMPEDPNAGAQQKTQWRHVRLNVAVTQDPREGKKPDRQGRTSLYIPCAMRGVDGKYVEVAARGELADALRVAGVGKGYSMQVDGVAAPAQEGRDTMVIAHSVARVMSPTQRKEQREQKKAGQQR